MKFSRVVVWMLVSLLPAVVAWASDLFWDSTFDTQALNGRVNAVAIDGTNVYVGGAFTMAGTLTVNGIARWDGVRWNALDFGLGTAGGQPGTCEAIAIHSNMVYVGGTFLTAGQLGNANNIARWNGSTWLPLSHGGTNHGVNFTCRAIAIASNGQVYAGGDFTRAGGVLVRRVARWNGTNWFALGVGLDEAVYALAIDSNQNVYAGGAFYATSDYNTELNGIGRWNGSSWSALGSGVDFAVTALVVASNNVLFAGGSFDVAGGVNATNIARWSGSSWSALAGGVSNDFVWALAFYGTNLVVGGDFVRAGRTNANRIAVWNGGAWSPLGSGLDNSVYALAARGNDLYVGGNFTTAGGKSSPYLARYNPTLPNVTVTVTDSNAVEGAVGDTITFTITRSGSTATNLTVTYAMGGTASAGADYVAPSGSVDIPAGQNSATVVITLIDDGVEECPETVVLNLTGLPTYTIGSPGNATATIFDNELPTVSITAPDASASEPGADTGTVMISRTGCLVEPLTVLLTVTGTATPGVDYVALPGLVALGAGQAATNLLIEPLDDAIAEGSETVVISIASNAAYRVSSINPTAAVTIGDNDAQGLIVAPTVVTVIEGSTGTFTVRLSVQPLSNITVNVSFAGGDTSLSIASGNTLTFTPTNWANLQPVTIAAAEDPDALNGTATFQVTSAGLPTQIVTATEADNDVLAIQVTPPSRTVAEGGSGTFNVVLTAQPTNNVTVSVARTDGDSDLSVTGGATLTFTPGNWNTAQTFTVSAAEDADAVNGSATFTASAPGFSPVSVTATEVDNDEQSLIVSTTALNVPEGGNAAFTVRLNAQPTNNVAVTVTRTSGDADLTGGGTLIFTPANWNTPQTVTITAAEDPDAVAGTATFTISSAGLSDKFVLATEIENDTQSLVLSTTSLAVPEGGTNTFTVRLNAQPTNTVVVTTVRTAGDPDIILVAGTNLTFSAGNWNVPQTVTVIALEDLDTTSDAALLTVSASGLPAALVTVNEVDNDSLNLIVSTTALVVPEGGTNTFTVRLSAQPATNTTVTVSRASGDADLNVTGGSTLQFTTGNWDTPQTVTLSAAEDLDTVNGSAIFTVASPGLSNQTVTATEADNDTLLLQLSTNTLSVAEGGTASLTVRLSAQPTNNIVVTTVRTAGDPDLTVSTGGTLTFTPLTWNTPQLITIAAAEDPDAVGSPATFSVSAPGLPAMEFVATELDNDTQGLLVSTNAVSVPEGGTAGFTVRLNAQPTNNVTVTVTRTAGDADLNVTGGATLTFTAGNWNTPQPVTLAAAEDVDVGNGVATITVASDGLPSQTVMATEVDNDVLLVLVSPTSLVVAEGGSNSFLVGLSAQPVTNIVVTTTKTGGDADLNVTGGAALTFTSDNWNTPQPVTISAAEDFDVINGTATFSVIAPGLTNLTVAATEADNDTLGLMLTTNVVSVLEGGSASVGVRLTAQPTNTLTVTTTRTAGDADLSVTGGATLTFNAGNWSVFQNITLSAAEDADAVSSPATFTVSLAGVTNATLTALEVDNDTLRLLVSTNAVTVAEGGTQTFTIRLSAQPTNNVVVTVSRTAGDPDLSVSGGATLTFSPLTWNTPQVVTVAAAQDADAVAGHATITVAADGLPDVTVTASEADDDTLLLAVSTNAVTVAEGGTASFSVVLTAQPTNELVVTTVFSSGDPNLTVTGGATLTFSPANWNTPQPVTLAAAEDADAVSGSATFTVSAPGLPAVGVTATELDNDEQGLVVSVAALTVPEGGANTFAVHLAAQPTNTVGVTVTRTAGDSDLAVTGGAALNFDAGNWNVPQTVTVGAAEDADAVNGSATLTVASAGLPAQTVVATEADDDTLEVAVSTPALTVLEGETNTFTVVLTAQPTNDVAVTVARTAGDSDVSVATAMPLTFTPGNWNTAQTVAVVAALDADAVNGSATLTVSAPGLPAREVSVIEADADVLGLVVTPLAVGVPEGGTATVQVRLSADPLGTVTATVTRVSGDTDLSGAAELVFDSGNWNVPQPVVLAAAEDDDAVAGVATFGVTADGLEDRNVTATEVENDVLALAVSSSAVTVGEGGTNSFTVVLTAQPTNDVAVTVTRTAGDSDVGVATAMPLVFTPGNWNVPQPVALVAGEDADAANGTATLTVSAPGLASRLVVATEADNDTLGLLVSVGALSVPEGGTNGLTVALTAQPVTNLLVTVARVSGDMDLVVSSGAALTFTPGNWNVPQPVVLAALPDADAVGGSAVFHVSAAGVATVPVTATELDDDTLALAVSATNVTVPEGGTATFGVWLTAAPTNTLVVSVARTAGDADVTVSGGATLSFHAGNWNVPQLVTLAAAQDVDIVAGTATISVSAAGLSSLTVTATEADDDSVEFLLSSATLTVPEGGANSFTVRLSHPPTNTVSVTVARTAGDSDITVSSGATLTFTPVNWNTPQPVTLAAAPDADIANDSATISVSAPGVPTATLVATEVDDDTLQLVVSATSLTVAEGGSATFTVALSAQPPGNVAVSVARTAGDADLNVTGGAALSFTAGNWDVPQTVTVSAAEDFDAVNGSATITVSAAGLASVPVTATEADNDTQGLVVSPTSLTVAEGGSAVFTVRLAAQPTNTVAVSVARTAGDTDLNVTGGATLSFTPGNWNVPQPVTVSAAEDFDAVNGSATITVSAAGLSSVPVTVTEADNDTQGLVVSPTSLTVAEGGSATFTVRLAAQPTNTVAVSVARTAGDADLNVTGGAALSFTAGNWNTPQTVTVSAAQDVDVVNGSATITVSSAGLSSVSVTATEADDDTLALLVSTNAVAVAEGGSATFTVRLNAQPGGDVIVSVSRSAGDADLNVIGGSVLTFTPGNWNTPQVVTLGAAEDDDAVAGSATITVSAAGTASVPVTATEVDNDTLAIVVSTSSLTVAEGGSATFTVRLAAQPTSTIVLTVSRAAGDSDLSVTGATNLTFSAGNWSVPQPVTIAAAEDFDAVAGSATFTVVGGGLPAQTVTATEADNDTLTLAVSASSLSVAEGGSATFTVVLTAQPTNAVPVTVARTAGDADLSVTGGASLTFGPGNWNVPQAVTVSAAEDDDAVAGTATITVSAPGLPAQSVTATEVDNDTLELVLSATVLSVPEGGSASFTVRLAAQPTNSVTVSVARTAGDASLTVSSGASLTFGPGNWNVPQAVTLAAAEDDDAANGTATFGVTAAGLPAREVVATELDNDTLELVVQPTGLTVSEGGSGTFVVRLTAQPLSNLVVTAAWTAGDASVSVTGGGTLTFTPGNWNVPQTVTVSAAEDDDAANGTATITVSGPGLASRPVTVTEADNDTLEIFVSVTALSVPEGGTNSFGVRLTAQPESNVVVTTSKTGGDPDLTVAGGGTLTFTPGTWNVVQLVRVAAAEDVDIVNGTAVLVVSAAGLAARGVTVTEADNDTLQLAVSTNGVAVAEGGSATFTVRLTAQPTAPVNVTVVKTGGDVSLALGSEATLTFGPGNWDVPQAVVITAAPDDDAVNGSATFTVSAPGMFPVMVTVTEVDDETQGFVVSAMTVVVPEGGSATFTVRLAAQPLSELPVSVGRVSGSGVLEVSAGGVLTFTPENWQTPQTVVLSAGSDADFVNQTAVFRVSGPGMASTEVVARQADNGQFIPLAGTFYGLGLAERPEYRSTGLLTLTLAVNGAVKGRLNWAGTRGAFKGMFDVAGRLRVTVPRSVGGPVEVELEVVDGEIVGTVSDGDWVSEVVARRAYGKTNLFGEPGTFTLLFVPDPAAAEVPRGYGHGLITIGADGKIKLGGVLADGLRFKPAKVALTQGGFWPLYVAGGNSVAGWVAVTNRVGQSDMDGEVYWIKLGSFSTTNDLVGSRLDTGNLGLGRTRVTLSGGGLPAPIVKEVRFNPTGIGVVVNPGMEGLVLRVTLAKGTFAGQFVHPVTGAVTALQGALFQKQRGGAGFFLSGGTSGAITIEDDPE